MNDLQKGLGHQSEATTRATGAQTGIKVVGRFDPCEPCIMDNGQGKTTNCGQTINSTWRTPVPGFTNTDNLNGKQHWPLMVDTATGYVWGFFLRFKSKFMEIVLGLI